MALLCLWEGGGHPVPSWRGGDHPPPISDGCPSFGEQPRSTQIKLCYAFGKEVDIPLLVSMLLFERAWEHLTFLKRGDHPPPM